MLELNIKLLIDSAKLTMAHLSPSVDRDDAPVNADKIVHASASLRKMTNHFDRLVTANHY